MGVLHCGLFNPFRVQTNAAHSNPWCYPGLSCATPSACKHANLVSHHAMPATRSTIRCVTCARIFELGSDPSERSQLPVHPHKIKIVPGFDDFAVNDSRNGHAAKIHWRLSCGNSEPISSVFATHRTTRSN